MVSISTGTSGGLPSENSSVARPDINATRARVSDATGSSPVGPRPISGNPIHREEFLCRVQTSRMYHGGTKLI